MRKLISLLLVVGMICSFAGCGGNTDAVEEKETETQLETVKVEGKEAEKQEIAEVKADEENEAEVAVEEKVVYPEFDDEDIYEAFEEAQDFYICWIYGQAYCEEMYLTYDDVYRAKIEDGYFNSASALKRKIKSYFEPSLAKQYINALDPSDEADGVHINVVEGVGDDGIMIVGYDVEKVSDTKYLLILNLESSFDEYYSESQILSYEYYDGKWLFGNYGDERDWYFGKCGAGIPVGYEYQMTESDKKQEFIKKATDIENYADATGKMAQSQAEINFYSSEIYSKWDSLLNEIYQYLKETLPDDEFEELKADELRWIKEKEKAIEEEGALWEGGSGEPMARNLAGASYTKERCYELIDMIR